MGLTSITLQFADNSLAYFAFIKDVIVNKINSCLIKIIFF